LGNSGFKLVRRSVAAALRCLVSDDWDREWEGVSSRDVSRSFSRALILRSRRRWRMKRLIMMMVRVRKENVIAKIDPMLILLDG